MAEKVRGQFIIIMTTTTTADILIVLSHFAKFGVDPRADGGL
jgi:hypothetical protein